MSDEKRRYDRLPASDNSEITVSPVKKTGIKTRIIDLSFGGAKIESEKKLSTGEALEIVISLPDGTSFKTGGTIVWEKPEESGAKRQFGLEFNNLDLAHKRLLEKYLKTKILSLAMTKSAEKRQHSRIDIEISQVFAKQPGTDKKAKGYVTNISLGGMNFASGREYELNEGVIFEFPFTDTIAFQIPGIIKRKEKDEGFFSYGIKFQPESEEQKIRVKNYILLKIK